MEFKNIYAEVDIGGKKTSHAWYHEIYPNNEVVIMDPDGWDRQNYQYSYFEELITFSQFMGRVMASTCIRHPPSREIEGLTNC
jgi:hypothetical protein